MVAPCSGVVVASRNDRPDMAVPQMDLEVFEGNHVVLSCGSLWVVSGDKVAVGDNIGRVGNSGRTTEPHLHLSAHQATSEIESLAGEPIAITIDGKFYVRNDPMFGR